MMRVLKALFVAWLGKKLLSRGARHARKYRGHA